MDVDRKRQLGGLAGSLDHPADTFPPERLTTLVDEDVSAFDAIFLLLPLQEPQPVDLVPLQIVRAVVGALEAAHNDGALGQVEVIPPQVASLGHAQTVPVDHEADQPVPMAMPVALESGQELGHLVLGEMLVDPVGRVLLTARTGRITLKTNVAEGNNLCGHCWAACISLVTI